MLPVLFHLRRVPIPTHDFFVLLGTAAAFALFVHEAHRRDRLDHRLLWVVAGALLGGAIGAKVGTAWEYMTRAPHPTALGIVVDGGKTILGGLPGAYIGAIIAKRLIGYREHTGDMFAPAIALGMSIGRVGCFLTEQIGTTTSLPWGVRVSSEMAVRIPNCPQCATGLPMHPSFAYEILFQLAMLGLLLWLRPRIHVAGELFKVYLFAYALFRFVVEFVRGNEVVLWGLTRPQLFLIPASGLLAAYFWRQLARGAYRTGTGGALVVPGPTLAPFPVAGAGA
jgi:phosphatidylglycerol---prolipoprotein diacylglyceryl transferase